MKKDKPKSGGMRSEYKRSDFSKLERGKYHKRVLANSNVVVIDPDVSSVFPNAVAVNNALHALIEVAQKASGGSKRPSGRAKRTAGAATQAALREK